MNKQIIDVYGDGSVIVEGNVGDLVSVPVPDHILTPPIGEDAILPWAMELLKVGLLLVEGNSRSATFQIMDLSGV